MDISYSAPGPVAEQFIWSDSFFSGLLGPVGSGKSSAACWKMLLTALRQEPWQGTRFTRWIAIRNTYPELKSTTIKTWQDWFPDEVAPIKWDTPITSHLRIADIGDGTGLDMEIMFIAIDRPEDVNKLRSLEATGIWINEASEIDQAILDMATQRIGRYPALRRGGPTWSGVIADTNPPDDDHWWYKFAEELRPKGYRFFKQPGALYYDAEAKEYKPNDRAENVSNIKNGYAYYFNMLAGKSEQWIKVFVQAQYGTTLAGKAVYPEWNDAYHTAKEPLSAINGLPIVLAWDFGLTPACVAMQMSPKGQVLVLREWTSEGMGIRQFATDVVRPAIFTEFPRFTLISVGDPAGTQRAQTDEKTCMQELLDCGFPTDPAPTNEFVARRESVAFWLLKTSGGDPGFLLDPCCTKLRKGFNGRYRYAQLKASGPSRFKDRPEKDEHSHPHDALQYGCLQMRAGLSPIRVMPVSKRRSSRGWT